MQSIESWSEQQQQSAKSLIMEYQHLFALTLNELGKTSLVQHDIKLDDETPFKERYQRIPPHQYEKFMKHLYEMLEIRAIQQSTSPWASPAVLVRKKDGSLRFCIELRKLNNKTIKDVQSVSTCFIITCEYMFHFFFNFWKSFIVVDVSMSYTRT